jgi:hypothetical protein
MRSLRPRKTISLSEKVQQHLNVYAVCGTAAGVGVLASPQAAESKVVYTPAHVQITSMYDLDLNHDGTTDFTILFSRNSTNSHGFCREPGVTDELLVKRERGEDGDGVVGGSFAYALNKGMSIGKSDHFSTHGSAIMAQHDYGSFPRGDRCKQINSYFGEWLNVANRYLGLKFLIHGKLHYGWARLDVSTKGGVQATLTGYAYETIPNKPIIAGETKGPDLSTMKPATLGVLAAGKH